MAKPLHKYQTFIKAPAERVWEALVNPEFTKEYFHAQRFESSLEGGAPYRMVDPSGAESVEVRSRRSTRRGGSSSPGGCSMTRR